MLKVLLYLLIIFWKIRIDTLHEGNCSTKIPHGRIPTRKIPTHQPLPLLKIPTRKIATQKILTWNIPTSFIVFLHLTFGFDKFKNMGGNIPGGGFPRGYSPGRSLIVGNFLGGSLTDIEENICQEFSSVHTLTTLMFKLKLKFRRSFN